MLFSGLIATWQVDRDSRYLSYVEGAMDQLVSSDGTIASYKAVEWSPDELALGHQVLFLIDERVGPDDPKGIGAFLLASAEMEPGEKSPR